jgi:alpha-tubulin suppressor-like RCC1 family protein
LGRKVTHNKISGGGFAANKATASIEHNKSQLADIGEIEFGAPIVKIATGRSHVLALDSRGKVWSWGANDKGQLGQALDTSSTRDTPQRIAKLKDIVQVYCGEHGSFAVDSSGDIYGWGSNKNNILLVNQPEKGIVKTIAEEPMLL